MSERTFDPGAFYLLGRKVIDGNGEFVEIDDPEWRARAERFLDETKSAHDALKALFDRAKAAKEKETNG